MAENSYFFNSSYSDKRTYRAEDFARYFESVLSSGIMPNFDGIRGATDGEYGLNVTNYIGSLRVGVKAGHAIIKGHRYELSGEERLTLRPTTGATVNRIDRIVLRLDRRASARHIKLFVVEGQEAYSAEPPALMRNANVHEISLAQVHITGGQSYIDKIVDERLDESVCGIANSLINVPTSRFVEQFNAWFNGYRDDAQSEFDTWFDSVKDVIDDSLANRLLQAVQALETKKADKTEVNALATNKVDKVYGKQLSTNDYTSAEKTLVAQIPQKANLSDVARIADGTPLFVYNTSDMTDTTRLYVNLSDGFIYAYTNGVWTNTQVQYQAAGGEWLEAMTEENEEWIV